MLALKMEEGGLKTRSVGGTVKLRKQKQGNGLCPRVSIKKGSGKTTLLTT